MATAKINCSISTPVGTFRETRTRTGTSVLSVNKSLDKAFYGVLVVRPTSQTATIVVNTEDHGFSPLDFIDLRFDSGNVCLKAQIITVTGEILTVDTSNAVPSFNTIPNSIGMGVAVSPQVPFLFDVANVDDIVVLSYGLKFNKTSGLTLPTTAHFKLDDGADPNYQVFLMIPPNGTLFDIDSVAFSESDLASLWTISALAQGTISCPSYETGANFKLYALLNTPGTGT